MTDFSDFDEYELNEKDIDSTIRFLKIKDPTNATPGKAIELLEYMQAAVHVMGHKKPESLEDWYDEMQAKK